MTMENLFQTIDIKEHLKALDSRLAEPARIVLAGSAVPILLGCEFRGTRDIDFAFLPSPEIRRIIAGDTALSRVFDLQAQGIIGLLEDAEDRTVHIDLGFQYLRVECLSLLDWVVSKLASPKLEDVLRVDGVTLEMLHQIERKLPFYCGISADRAYMDLQYLIREKSADG